jgi:hypothetical protein
MRFDNEGMSLWFGTLDAPGPGDTVPAGAEIAITIAVHPGDRSNKVEVLYRVNKGPDERVTATWLRNDAPANVQYFRARLPPRAAGDTVEYIPVCRRAGGTVPSEDDIKRGGPSFRVTEAPIETPGKAPSSRMGPVAAAGVDRAAPATRTTMLTGDAPGIGGPGPGTTPLGASTESGGGSIPGMGIAAESHTEPAAGNKSDPTAENAAALPNHKIRLDTLHAVLATKEEKQAVETEFQAAKGDWTAALANLKDKLPEASSKKVAVAHSLADWSADNVPVVKAVLGAQPDLTSLRDLALRFNVDPRPSRKPPWEQPPRRSKRTSPWPCGRSSFWLNPPRCCRGWCRMPKMPIANGDVRSGVTKFLSNQPEFDIRKTSIYTALKFRHKRGGLNHGKDFRDTGRDKKESPGTITSCFSQRSCASAARFS